MSKNSDNLTTVGGIYSAINDLPSALNAKGKITPEVRVQIPANSEIEIVITWRKSHSGNEWDREYNIFRGATFNDALADAVAMINALPSAKEARLTRFMGQLGKLIDDGRSDGIDTDFINPLTATMKKLSKNILTYRGSIEAAE